jgi:hypothetical protein
MTMPRGSVSSRGCIFAPSPLPPTPPPPPVSCSVASSDATSERRCPIASDCAPGCEPAAFHASRSAASRCFRKCSSRFVCSRRSRTSAGLLTGPPAAALLDAAPPPPPPPPPPPIPTPAPLSRADGPASTADGVRSTGGRPGGLPRTAGCLPPALASPLLLACVAATETPGESGGVCVCVGAHGRMGGSRPCHSPPGVMGACAMWGAGRGGGVGAEAGARGGACSVRTNLSCAPTPFSSRSRCERSCTSSSNWWMVWF